MEQHQLEKLTQLHKDTHNHYHQVITSEDLLLNGERLESARLLLELAFHLKQLQLEVLKLEQLHNKPTR